MEANKRVRDVMIPIADYPSIRDRATLREAAAVMEAAHLEVNGRRSLPRALVVFDEIRVMVGTVRRRDLMRGLEPKFLLDRPLKYRRKLFDVAVDPNLTELPYDRMVQGIRERADRPVSDVMRPIEAVLDADDHVMKAIYEMVTLDVSLLPVTENDRLAGVVRSADVFHEVVKLL